MVGWHMTPAPPSHLANVGGEVLPDEFGTEPLVGYRGWLVVNAGDQKGYALRSLHVPYIWDRDNEAFCHRPASIFLQGRHVGQLSPDPGCSCGIYAQLPEHTLSDWERAKVGAVAASGTIAMWGRIIQCEKGYKAQRAEIQDPVVLDMSCVPGCDRQPSRIGLPDHSQSPHLAYCDEHVKTANHQVTVQAGIWLEEVCKQLSSRYRLDFLSWS